jgi:hypothetical protein
MDMDKFVMLKGSIGMREYVSIDEIKMQYDVTGKEAEEMIMKLAQAGLCETYPFDGVRYRTPKGLQNLK